MEQNYIINLASELLNNLYSDISNTTSGDICYNTVTTQLIDVSSTLLNMFSPNMYRQNMFRPIIISYLNEDTSHNNSSFSSASASAYQNQSSSSYLQNIIYNNTIYDSSYIPLASARNNYSRAINLRDILRTLYVDYTDEDENNTFLETFINSTFENKAKFKKVISTSELEKLKPQKFNKINETTSNIQCPILYYNFEENEEIIKLPCNHNYNCYAILKWLSEESNTCPVCRHEFDYKEIIIDNKRQEHEDASTQNGGIQNVETTSIHNLFSNEEILMQEILLNSYSNSNV